MKRPSKEQDKRRQHRLAIQKKKRIRARQGASRDYLRLKKENELKEKERRAELAQTRQLLKQKARAQKEAQKKWNEQHNPQRDLESETSSPAPPSTSEPELLAG